MRKCATAIKKIMTPHTKHKCFNCGWEGEYIEGHNECPQCNSKEPLSVIHHLNNCYCNKCGRHLDGKFIVYSLQGTEDYLCEECGDRIGSSDITKDYFIKGVFR